MVIKKQKHPTEDLVIQLNHLDEMVKEASELPSAANADDFSEVIDGIMRYAHYHLQCVMQFRRLNDLDETLEFENCNDKITDCLIGIQQGTLTPSEIQLCLLNWFSLFKENVRYK